MIGSSSYREVDNEVYDPPPPKKQKKKQQQKNKQKKNNNLIDFIIFPINYMILCA